MDCWKKLPDKFILRLKEIIKPEDLNSVLQSYCTPKPLTIRVNTLKITKDSLKEKLQSENLNITEIDGINNAFIVLADSALKLTGLESYKQGLFYIQNISSMLPALILNPKPNELVLDMAAAPGNKTTQLSQMMDNSGEIIANDISRQRLFKLKAITKQLGVTNVKTLQIPGEYIWKKYPNYFDKVLVDAPCTMEGRFNPNSQESFKDWSTKKVKVLSHLQKRLLKSAFYAAKPGGVIVYSTCTISPEENEEVIDEIIKEEKEHIYVEEIKISDLKTHALTSWKNKSFSDEIKKTLRINPSNTMEGFYVAKIKRLS